MNIDSQTTEPNLSNTNTTIQPPPFGKFQEVYWDEGIWKVRDLPLSVIAQMKTDTLNKSV